MKNKIFLCLFVTLTFFSCSKRNNINIEIANANGKTVYLQKIINNETVNVDSCIIEKNKALLNAKTDKNNEAYHLYIKGWHRAIPFFTDNKDVTINGDFNAYHKINITASETQKKFDEILIKLSNYEDNNKKSFIADIVKDNSNSDLAPYIIYRHKWLFNLDELNNLVKENFSDDFNSGYYQKLVEYIESLERTKVGQQFIDFTLNNIENQPITLSSLIKDNKLVLIDFWASWCPDCRVENPNVVAVYDEYKDKGLEIISVSLDTDKNAWIEGIKEDNLYWKHHVSDLKGWNCAPASEYGVAFIPQNVIINSEGIIVAKNLNGRHLNNFVSLYLK